MRAVEEGLAGSRTMAFKNTMVSERAPDCPTLSIRARDASQEAKLSRAQYVVGTTSKQCDLRGGRHRNEAQNIGKTTGEGGYRKLRMSETLQAQRGKRK